MIGVLLALAASLSWGLSDFGAGVSSRRLPIPAVLAVSQLTGLAFVGLLVLAIRPEAPTAAQLVWGAFAGLIGVFALSCFYRALSVGVMGIVGPISTTGAIVPLVYGLVRGERPSMLQGLGVALAVVGVVAASIELAHAETGGRRIGAGVGLALLAALGFGTSLIALSKAAPGGVLWAPLSMRAAAAPLVLIGVFALRRRTEGLRGGLPILLAVGVADTSANILFGLASTRGLLSVVSVLASLYPVVLVVLARLLLHERMARHQLSGVAAALAGVALISAG